MRNFILYSTIVFLTFFLSLTIEKAVAFSDEKSDSSNYVTGITAGRARSLVGVVIGALSLIIGWRISRKAQKRRIWFMVALIFGIIAIILSLTHLGNTGGFGTGGGKAGAIVGLAFGILGLAVNGYRYLSNKN